MSIVEMNLQKSGKYLTIKLQHELHGISVDKILQIIAIPEITPVPKTKSFMKGVFNLRGKIIPIIDLRLILSMPKAEYNDRTSIVIIKTQHDQQEILIGTVVDTVYEVINIVDSQIEEKPSFGTESANEFIIGIAHVDNKVVSLLDIDKILSKKEIENYTK